MELNDKMRDVFVKVFRIEVIKINNSICLKINCTKKKRMMDALSTHSPTHSKAVCTLLEGSRKDQKQRI